MKKAPDYLLHNLILFGRLLRALGLDVNPGRMMDLVQALAFVEIGQRADFYFTARSLLVHNKADVPLFDVAFDLFWRKHSEAGVVMPLEGDSMRWRENEKRPLLTMPSLQEKPVALPQAETDDEDIQEVIEVTYTYSRRELLRHKDFSEMSVAEVEEVKAFMREVVWVLGLRRTRRHQPGQGYQLDLRRTFRHNLRYGGELLQRPRRQPKYKPRPLVILADISGSMERYTRLLLYFVYSLAKGLDEQVEAFVFSTQLTRITRQLRNREIEVALQEVAMKVVDWSGGTRIGDALKTFNFDWGRRVLGRGAVVLLISDGWDRGDPVLLGQEMARLQRSCYRLVWLNPLLGSERYEPLTRGMQAALPYIDDFLPVHNLASLTDLALHLNGLTEGKRPFRGSRILLSGAAFVRDH